MFAPGLPIFASTPQGGPHRGLTLDRAQIKLIVGLQLERVRRMVHHSKGIAIVFDDRLVEYFAKVGRQPEYGAHELRRQIRQHLETKLAEKALAGEIMENSSVVSSYDQASRDIVLYVEELAPAVPNGEGAAKSVAAKSPASGRARLRTFADLATSERRRSADLIDPVYEFTP